MDADNEFITAIAPDVLKALEDKSFFETLDDQMCPKDPRSARVLCQGTLAISTTALANCGFDEEEVTDILEVLASRGGFCDCEVLYNVPEESRLKSEFWKAVAAKRRPVHSHDRPGAHHNPATSLVRLWIFIEKDEVGYPESQDWEDLWAQPTSDGWLLIETVPFFAKGIARKDKVTAVVSSEGFLAVDKITDRGGHSTFRIWMAEDLVGSIDHVMADLERMGAVVEVTLQRLMAIDTAAEHEPDVWDYLQQGTTAARWELQVAYSPD